MASATSISYAQMNSGFSMDSALKSSAIQQVSYSSEKRATTTLKKKTVAPVIKKAAPLKAVKKKATKTAAKKTSPVMKKAAKPAVTKKPNTDGPLPAFTQDDSKKPGSTETESEGTNETPVVNAPEPTTPMVNPQTQSQAVTSEVVATKPTLPRVVCPVKGATIVDALTNQTLTCAPYTKLGSLGYTENRWSIVYPQDGSIHALVNKTLAAYQRSFPTPADQQVYEDRITSDLELAAFIDLLVVMDKKAFPGFADVISQDTSLADAIKPWAAALAQRRGVPDATFNIMGEGFMAALGANQRSVTQDAFESLYSRTLAIQTYADTIDKAYWLNYPNPSLSQVSQRFIFIDSLLSMTSISAQSAYLKKAQAAAKFNYPSYATSIDKGQTIDQIMAPWVAHFADQLELYRGGINPIQERTLIQAAITPPLSMADFDATLAHDPRWLQTQKAKEAAAGKPSF
ncbi:MAG: hypothetical protein F2927_01125 [Actinobacteria bacterium]|nr:hypothetical protein [Actinomycetota bacterium]MSZ68728.1 hypothetical protein [Actinomycetota bacterium]MTB15357.1 hypothetical protein [Actinomycetota bacterium]